MGCYKPILINNIKTKNRNHEVQSIWQHFQRESRFDRTEFLPVWAQKRPGGGKEVVFFNEIGSEK